MKLYVICPDCGIKRNLEEAPDCPICYSEKETFRIWPDKYKYHKKWQKEHKDKVLEYVKKYRIKNKNKEWFIRTVKESQKKWDQTERGRRMTKLRKLRYYYRHKNSNAKSE